ncbi:heavy-metal-associated domain-containing protein [Psychroflexus salis]|uniref:HMA domain-containing protein n=1 Tax=Psychroflexus salis TaxID=1526574 RepID=A0A916ZT14_9FLAO|nr:heavy metal-associated domain-containing protein [Psychroflexus salis]GGE12760.1 hypothetical protein GCM10010831_12730 [Psychroflexus salis]
MELNFKVQNLKCGGCANSITKKLLSLNEVNAVNVNSETAEVTVSTTNASSEAILRETLLSLGYPVEGDKNAITSKAKSFISCATGRMSN